MENEIINLLANISEQISHNDLAGYKNLLYLIYSNYKMDHVLDDEILGLLEYLFQDNIIHEEMAPINQCRNDLREHFTTLKYNLGWTRMLLHPKILMYKEAVKHQNDQKESSATKQRGKIDIHV